MMKFIAAILAVFMLVSCFAACGDKDQKETTPKATTPSTPAPTTPSTPKDETPDTPDEIVFEDVNETVYVDVFTLT